VPRQTLTREQIVSVAVDLLDAEGLEGLSMRALGARLGSAATTVYWHVGGKDELVALAGDQVWSEIELPDLSAGTWRDAARAMARELHAMLVRHPWLMQAFGTVLLSGPGKARHDEHSLAVYEAAGFTGSRVDQAAASVFTYVLGNALGPSAAASLGRKVERDGQSLHEGMARAREVAAQFPRLQARLQTAAAGYAAAPQGSFDFGLHAMLDGLEAELATASRPSGSRHP
jgi:AcrR family transcriptional regulator